MTEAEKQRALKYEHHDLHIEDLTERDVDSIKSDAIKAYVNKKETNTTRIIIDEFMRYLAAHGYRITKKDKK